MNRVSTRHTFYRTYYFAGVSLMANLNIPDIQNIMQFNGNK